MLAGKPANKTEELVYAIREICPDMGFIERNGEIILTGNGIRHLKDVLDAISKIERVAIVNKHGTMAILETKEKPMTMTDMPDSKRGEIICATA